MRDHNTMYVSTTGWNSLFQWIFLIDTDFCLIVKIHRDPTSSQRSIIRHQMRTRQILVDNGGWRIIVGGG